MPRLISEVGRPWRIQGRQGARPSLGAQVHTCTQCGGHLPASSQVRKYCSPRCKNAGGAKLRRARNEGRATRRCYRCKQTKPAAAFGGPTKPYCKDCMNAYQREYTAAQPAEVKRARRQRSYATESVQVRSARVLLWRWGMTQADLDARLQAQGGHCAICPTTEPGGRGRWHVDHDHNCCPPGRGCSNCIRGLLCTRCNVGLGQFRDSPELLAAAIAYLTARPPAA